jgi:hypothetical protein
MNISMEKGGDDVLLGVGDSKGLEGRKKVRNKGREGREEAVAAYNCTVRNIIMARFYLCENPLMRCK